MTTTTTILFGVLMVVLGCVGIYIIDKPIIMKPIIMKIKHIIQTIIALGLIYFVVKVPYWLGGLASTESDHAVLVWGEGVLVLVGMAVVVMVAGVVIWVAWNAAGEILNKFK